MRSVYVEENAAIECISLSNLSSKYNLCIMWKMFRTFEFNRISDSSKKHAEKEQKKWIGYSVRKENIDLSDARVSTDIFICSIWWWSFRHRSIIVAFSHIISSVWRKSVSRSGIISNDIQRWSLRIEISDTIDV